jgi:hypothetical protein
MDNIIKELKLIRNYFGEHDKTIFEHHAYSVMDSVIKEYESKRLEKLVIKGVSQPCAVAENMITDKREIKIVCNDEACVTMWKVGAGGVTKIECYGEYGEYAVIPFLAIYKGEQIIERSPALKFRIVYEI